MVDVEAQRTLVKSPPELWGLLSDPESLARHLAEFGEVRIVGTEPESTVSWEGQAVTGTVELKASGWGTKVTLTATRQPPAPPEPEPEPAVEPEPESEPEPKPKVGFFARIFRRRKPDPAPEPEPQATVEPEQPDLAAELLALEESLVAETTAVLSAVLDKLGAAHHRPFSRA
jgi:hypothetical protein